MWPFNRMGRPDPTALFNELGASYSKKNYSKMDRYKDYRGLFLGSELGKRVLADILDRGGMFRPPVANSGQIDPLRAMVRVGEQNLARWIVNSMNAEPGEERPERAEKGQK